MPALLLFVAAVVAVLVGTGGPVASSVGPTAQAADSDGDGWSDEAELFIGTLPDRKCSTTSGASDEDPDAYPPDTNDDTRVNTLDIGKFVPFLNSFADDGRYRPRFDLTTDGRVNTIDIARYIPILGMICVP